MIYQCNHLGKGGEGRGKGAYSNQPCPLQLSTRWGTTRMKDRDKEGKQETCCFEKAALDGSNPRDWELVGRTGSPGPITGVVNGREECPFDGMTGR